MTKRIKLKKPSLKLSLLIFGIVVVLLVGIFAAYYFSFQNKILLNVYAGNLNLSGKSKAAAEEQIANVEKDNLQSKIKLISDQKNYELTFENLGWSLDPNQLSSEAFNFGHSQSTGKNVWALLSSVILNKKFDFAYEYNQGQIEDWLSTINSEIGTPEKEANLQVKDGNVKVIDPQVGKTFDILATKREILSRLNLEKSGDIKLDLVESDPQISSSEAETLKDKAVELTKTEVKLNGPNGSVTLSSNDLGSMIELKKPTIKKSFLSAPELGPVYLSFDNDKIKDFLDKNSDAINVSSTDAKFAVENGSVTIFQASKAGKSIKTDDSVNLIITELEKGQTKEIDLPSEITNPSVSANQVSDIEKYGIKELIATATTDFGNSPSNRIHNIQTGIAAISGALVKPGEEFSTISRLGKIDASSGYLPELVIKGSETTPDYGGGLCQVSTTLFRSVMNAGLDITARTNHSYRVSYYEPPVGMDATIYSPRPDFKFVNNTGNYILLEGHVDGHKVTFDIYGTKDSRSIEITTPVVYDTTPPADTIYIDDPSLAPGETKQIDHGHPGAKAYFYYRVTKDGKTSETKFTSSYVPWPAKFLKGPDASPPSQ